MTPSYGLALSVLGIRPTYKMRNISELSQQIYSKLSGFLPLQFVAQVQKITEIVGPNFDGGGGKEIFLTPHICPNFGDRDLKIF